MEKIVAFLRGIYQFIASKAQDLVVFFKIACRNKATRKIIALCFLMSFLVAIYYIVRVDLCIERWQFPFDVTEKSLDYHFRFRSIDYNNRIVSGNLELRLSPIFDIHAHEAKCRFGPLVYDDGMSRFSLEGLKSLESINGAVLSLARTTEFKEQVPTAVRFEFELVGEPKFYPFDEYLLVGAAKCMLKCVPKTLNFEGEEDITVTQDIPGLLIRRARFDEVKDFGEWQRLFDDETFKIEISDFTQWNKEHVFLLMLYRPFFLRSMTVILGIVAAVSVLYIAIWRPLKDIPMNAMAYFVALWAIREILYHGTTAFPTLIDYGVLVLYVCLIFGAVFRWIWPRMEPNQKED